MHDSITKHELWDELAEYFAIKPARDTRGRQVRVRIEVRNMPADLAKRALAAEVKCCSCGEPHHPIRKRKGPPKRGDTRHTDGSYISVYFAAGCPLDVNVSCSRGAAATAEYERVQTALRLWEEDHATQP